MGGDYVLVVKFMGGDFVHVYKNEQGGFCPGGFCPTLEPMMVFSDKQISIL